MLLETTLSTRGTGDSGQWPGSGSRPACTPTSSNPGKAEAADAMTAALGRDRRNLLANLQAVAEEGRLGICRALSRASPPGAGAPLFNVLAEPEEAPPSVGVDDELREVSRLRTR